MLTKKSFELKKFRCHMGHDSMFMNIMNYRCNQYDREFVQIGRFEPSTSECYDCGYHMTGLTLADRSWTCPNCGTVHDRDINAAKVIYRKGLSLLSKDNPEAGRALPASLGKVSPDVALQQPAFAA